MKVDYTFCIVTMTTGCNGIIDSPYVQTYSLEINRRVLPNSTKHDDFNSSLEISRELVASCEIVYTIVTEL